MISHELYEEGFAGYHIYDCEVRTKSTFSFILCETLEEKVSDEPKKRLLNYFMGIKEEIGYGQYTGFEIPKLAVAQQPCSQAVMVAVNGVVAVQGAGVSSMEGDIPRGVEGAMIRGIHGMTNIDGYVYVTGPWRSVAKRVGPNQWESVVDRKTSMPVPMPNRYGSADAGFDGIDGFNKNDIYCVGYKGDVWRYDGERWQPCIVPTNLSMETVCCAGDGFVYIGMAGGSVIKGRENSWEVIHTDRMTLPFTDMVWYADRVWCTSDHGLWVIENNKLVKADVPADVNVCSGHLSAGDGVLLLAGVNGAALFNGTQWEIIIKSMRQ
jgi:hypothetical protein